MTSPWLLAAQLLTVSLLVTFPLASAGPSPEQHGENGLCADFNALYMTPQLKLEAIVVEGGTGYNANHTGGRALYIDFYDATGTHIGDNALYPDRTPPNAIFGTLCVGALGGGWPDIPATEANWTYQDGL